MSRRLENLVEFLCLKLSSSMKEKKIFEISERMHLGLLSNNKLLLCLHVVKALSNCVFLLMLPFIRNKFHLLSF